MFSSIARKQLLNLQTLKVKFGVSTFTNIQYFKEKENFRNLTKFVQPVEHIEPIVITWYCPPKKCGCGYKKLEVSMRKILKKIVGYKKRSVVKNDYPRNYQTPIAYKIVCPQRQRPPQPSSCSQLNEYKAKDLGTCPGPCPRAKNGKNIPSDKCKDV